MKQRFFSRLSIGRAIASLLAVGVVGLSIGAQAEEAKVRPQHVERVGDPHLVGNTYAQKASDSNNFFHGPGTLEGSQSVLSSIEIREKGDNPLGLRVEFDSAPSNIKGRKWSSGGALENDSFSEANGDRWTVKVGNSNSAITAIKVCQRKVNQRLKGAQVWYRKINLNGTLGPEETNEWTGWSGGAKHAQANCNDWLSKESCPSGEVAVGVQFDKGKNLHLICSKLDEIRDPKSAYHYEPAGNNNAVYKSNVWSGGVCTSNSSCDGRFEPTFCKFAVADKCGTKVFTGKYEKKYSTMEPNKWSLSPTYENRQGMCFKPSNETPTGTYVATGEVCGCDGKKYNSAAAAYQSGTSVLGTPKNNGKCNTIEQVEAANATYIQNNTTYGEDAPKRTTPTDKPMSGTGTTPTVTPKLK